MFGLLMILIVNCTGIYYWLMDNGICICMCMWYCDIAFGLENCTKVINVLSFKYCLF